MSEAIRDLMRDEINEAEQKGEARGRMEGEAKGRMEGMLKTLVELVQNGMLSIAAAAGTAKMSEAEFVSKMSAVSLT